MKPRLSLILALLALGIAARLAPYALSHFGISIDPGNTVYPGIPYFRNTLISMAVFLPLLFSQVALKRPVPAQAYRFGGGGS